MDWLTPPMMSPAAQPTALKDARAKFGSALIKGNGKAALHVNAPNPFRGNRLLIPSSIADDFRVHDIRIGCESACAGGGMIPAAAFSELAIGVALGLQTASAGMWVSIVVENMKPTPTPFIANLFGVYAFEGQRSRANEDDFEIVCDFGEQFVGAESDYEAWATERERLYENIIGDDESGPFQTFVNMPNADCVETMIFQPEGNWWCDEHGTLVRPVFFFERKFELGRRIGKLTIVDPVTYEGFDESAA